MTLKWENNENCHRNFKVQLWGKMRTLNVRVNGEILPLIETQEKQQ